MKKLMTIIFGVGMMCLTMTGCKNKHPEVPANATASKKAPNIFPDYKDVVVPPNIAPLNFKVTDHCDEVVARLTYGGENQQTYGDGNKVQIPEDEWKEILASSKGKDIRVEIFASDKGAWTAFKAFNISVAQEEIDPYISYRLINPSYVAYEELRICERNLTNYEEKDIYNNMIISTEAEGQCINCHSYQNYKTDNMQFHMRQAHGGTMLVYNGKPKKINLKTPEVISAGVYPSWHPTLPLIAYSTNSTGQSFHTKERNKIEVQDAASDLILYDIESNTITNIENDSTEFEVFPWWSPEGDTLYYCSAHFEFSDTAKVVIESKSEDVYGNKTDKKDDKLARQQSQIIEKYMDIKYNVYRKPFDRKTKTFGPKEMVFDAAAQNKSATIPRVSPDGRYVLYGLGNFGVFHIWHPDADLYVTDLRTMESRPLKEANSMQADSYHSWSSNGRWILFASRRDDGNYSRLYISYFDKNGNAHKPFELPQEDPDFYRYQLKSYNVPEFMVEPVKISAQEFRDVAMGEAENVKFKQTGSQPASDGTTGASPQAKGKNADGTTGATPKAKESK